MKRLNNITNNLKSNIALLLLLIVVGCSSLLIFLWSTPYGLGVSPDSTVYLNVSQSILRGEGINYLDEPLTHYPPAYPLLLALSSKLGSAPLDGARIIHALLFASNASLIGIITYLSTDKSILASLCSILLFLSSPKILNIHAMAWSESTFLLSILSAILLFSIYVSMQNVWLLLGASALVSMTLITRYIGLAILPPMLFILFFWGSKTVKTRFRTCLFFLIICISPLAIWFVRNAWVADSIINRAIVYHPIGTSDFIQLINTLYDYWLPVSKVDYLNLLQLIAASGLLFYGFLNILKDHRGRSNLQINIAMQLTIVLFSLTYILALILSISFIDAHTPIDGRTLSPVYVCGVIFVVSTAWNFKPLRRKLFFWRSFQAMLSVVISVNLVMVIFSAIQMHNEGLGFTNRIWRNSQTIAYVSSLPSEVRIYSNGPDAILYLNSWEVQSIPRKVSTISQASNPRFENEVVEMRNDLMQNGALIVYFDNITWRWYLPNKAELENDYGFQVLLQLQDGTIYGLSDFDLSTEEGGT